MPSRTSFLFNLNWFQVFSHCLIMGKCIFNAFPLCDFFTYSFTALSNTAQQMLSGAEKFKMSSWIWGKLCTEMVHIAKPSSMCIFSRHAKFWCNLIISWVHPFLPTWKCSSVNLDTRDTISYSPWLLTWLSMIHSAIGKAYLWELSAFQ